MSISRPLRVLALVLCSATLVANPAKAQSFAVGGGGSFVNDTGSEFSTTDFVTSFDTVGAHLFGDVVLEDGVVFEARTSQFGLEGSVAGAPNLKATAGTLSVTYLFREAWIRAGFVAGGGVYRVVPRPIEGGQVAADVSQTSFGFFGGLVSVFDIGKRWDARLEVTIHSIRTDYRHTPVFLTGGIAYHF